MSKLTDFYAHKAALIEKNLPVDAQWELLEDQLLKEELLPEMIEQLKTVLSKVKSRHSLMTIWQSCFLCTRHQPISRGEQTSWFCSSAVKGM